MHPPIVGDYMGILDAAKGVVSGFVQSLKPDWWVEVKTAEPPFTYYFGPFDKMEEAEDARPGYVEDLEHEGAKGIVTQVKRCNPHEVTISNH